MFLQKKDYLILSMANNIPFHTTLPVCGKFSYPCANRFNPCLGDPLENMSTLNILLENPHDWKEPEKRIRHDLAAEHTCVNNHSLCCSFNIVNCVYETLEHSSFGSSVF